MVLEYLDSHRLKQTNQRNLNSNLISYARIHSKWITDWNVKCKIFQRCGRASRIRKQHKKHNAEIWETGLCENSKEKPKQIPLPTDWTVDSRKLMTQNVGNILKQVELSALQGGMLISSLWEMVWRFLKVNTISPVISLLSTYLRQMGKYIPVGITQMFLALSLTIAKSWKQFLQTGKGIKINGISIQWHITFPIKMNEWYKL